MTRLCPECLAPIEHRAGSEKSFCSPAHKADWHNRSTVRGRVLTTLKMAERITRGGSRGDKETGKHARREADQLIQRWVDEDRAAKRMDAVAYIAQRRSIVPTLSDLPTTINRGTPL